MTFAQQLRAERKRLNLSQPHLAKLLGVSFACVSKWERELVVPAEIAQEGALTRLKNLPTNETR